MSTVEQLFLFPSLDFPGRTTLTADEVADRLGITTRQILDLVDEGEITGVDLAGKGASRRWVRIPIECYHAFILKRITGPHRADFLRCLPKTTLRDLRREIDSVLAA